MWRRCVVCWLTVAMAVSLSGCGGDDSDTGGGKASFQQRKDQAMKLPADEQARKLARIGYQEGKAGNELDADKTLRAAERAARDVEDPSVRAVVLCMVVEAYSRLNHRGGAAKTAEKAAEAIEQAEDGPRKAKMLARVGWAFTMTNDPDRATGFLDSAQQMAATLQDPADKVAVLVEVAVGYQAMQQADDVRRVVSEALRMAATVTDPRQRCETIAGVAAKLHTIDAAQSAQAFDAALTAAEQIAAPQSQAYVLTDLAEAISKTGDTAKAHRVLDTARTTAKSIPERDLQKQALDRIRELSNRLPNRPAE